MNDDMGETDCEMGSSRPRIEILPHFIVDPNFSSDRFFVVLVNW